ncbi:MAG: hypothetical protein WA354_15810 [Terracidiphilus sp.]
MRTLQTLCCATAVLLLFVCTTTQEGSALAKDAPTRGSKITIPPATPLTVQLDQVVSAKMDEGRDFTVTFTEPVQVDGMLLIPAGATGAGLVTSDAQHSRQIELNSIFANGRSYRVTTSPIMLNPKAPYPAGKKLTFDLVLALRLQ